MLRRATVVAGSVVSAVGLGGLYFFEGGGLDVAQTTPARKVSADSKTAATSKPTAIVIGGGAVGTSTAYVLARRGYQVHVLDAGDESLFHAASYGNAQSLGLDNYHTMARWDFVRNFIGSMAEGYLRRFRENIGIGAVGGDGDGDTQWNQFCQHKFIDAGVLTDLGFWRWAACYCRSVVDTRAHKAQDNNWEPRIAGMREALFSLARDAGIYEASDFNIGGKLLAHLSKLQKPSHNRSKPPTDPKPPQELGYWPEMLRDAVETARIESAHFRSDFAQGDSLRFCAELRRKLLEMDPGNKFSFGRTVASITVDKATGHVSGVVETNGDSHEADVVLVCSGAHSGKLLAGVGVTAPVYPLRGYSITAPVRKEGDSMGDYGNTKSSDRLRALDQPQPYCVVAPFTLYVTPMSNPRRIRFTNFGELAPEFPRDARRMGNPGGDPKLFQRLEAMVRHVCPSVDSVLDMSDAVEWVGERPLTPDCYPIVGACRIPGLFINTGHSFNGWRDCAYTAQLAAECVEEGNNSPLRKREVEMLFSLERFKFIRSIE
mmetsp:Transcript_3895/g.7436  ORF Transcript_3895/g.7436 Transcript_3895/m.7436 type:complete len:545 (+) Transcript_3895:21-1655(+)